MNYSPTVLRRISEFEAKQEMSLAEYCTKNQTTKSISQIANAVGVSVPTMSKILSSYGLQKAMATTGKTRYRESLRNFKM